MTLHPVDYLLAFVLVAVMPLYGVWEMRLMRTRLAAGNDEARLTGYRLTIAVEWALTVAVLVSWFAFGRNAEMLGLLAGSGAGWWMSLAIGAGVCGSMIVQSRAILRDPEKLDKVAPQFEDLEAMIPRTQREATTFTALSVTAGICEEILYRGFLIAVIAVFVDTWIAVVLAAAGFGVAHVYQGGVGVLKTGAVGLVMGAIYVASGSLWVPIVLHAAIDLNSGHIGRRVLSRPQPIS